ncbi:MAG: oligosaccharide flippase family protein [Chloroflexi bacterium]|nr:oligosaccharide flippase family protein [Chloroflexota bacterium]
MSVFQKISTALREDQLFRRVLNSSLHLFSSNTLSVVLSFVQGIFATRLLGPDGYGLIGIVMGYASTVNSILSFRMSEIVVRYGGEYLEKGEKKKASALVKTAGLTEMLVSVLAFLIVALTAGWAARNFSGPPAAPWMFTVFAVGLLANFNYETSTGILQVTNRIKLQGTINLIQSIITTFIIVAASIWNGNLVTVLYAYLLSKTILGLGMFLVAQIQLQRVLGGGWWKEPLSTLTSTRELMRFAVSSNVSATIIKIFRESEILWVGLFLSNEAAGYYRVAYTIVSFLHIPADPLIAASFPEINRLAAQQAWTRLKEFLRKITTFSFLYNLALALGLVLLGHWVILFYSGEEYLPAYPAMMALLVGLAFNYTLFWNRPLLLSMGLPTFPVRVTLIVGLIKIALAFLLVPRYGIVAAGALLSFYYIASVGVMAWRGAREIHHQEAHS